MNSGLVFVHDDKMIDIPVAVCYNTNVSRTIEVKVFEKTTLNRRDWEEEVL